LINGWEIEIEEDGKVIHFSSDELELENKDPDYVSLNGLLSDMSYEDNKEFWDQLDEGEYEEDEVDFEEELEYDDGKVEQIVKDFFDDQTLVVNIRTSQDDS
jgi:hypothetical protein